MGRVSGGDRVIWEMEDGKIGEGMEIEDIKDMRDDKRIEKVRVVSREENWKKVWMRK